MPHASFLHAADASVVGKVERDHSKLGMYRLRPQQSGFGRPTPSPL